MVDKPSPADRAPSSDSDTQIDPTQPIDRPIQRKILLSYRRDDSGDVTGRIYDRLIQRFGRKQIFKDVDSIPLGVDFRKHLTQIVESSDVVVAVIGDRWNGAGPDTKTRLDDAKDYVRIELEAALQRDILVIPVLVRGAQIPNESDLPSTLAALAYRNGLPVRPDPDFHRDVDRLIEGVLRHFGEQSDVIGLHRIVRRIGTGNQGVVYEAEQPHTHRRVALKLIRADAIADDTLDRFHREMEVLGRLQHEAIARIYEAGTGPWRRRSAPILHNGVGGRASA